MNHELQHIRSEYQKGELSISSCPKHPGVLFQKWIDQAIAAQVLEPTAMILSTSTLSGQPSSRVVLLKGFDASGLRFFTNYQSRKADEIAENAQVSVLFFWPSLERQIRMEGRIRRLPLEESKAYFKTRPWESQINAIISPQSQEIPNRQFLIDHQTDLKTKLQAGEQKLEKPDYWGGYLIEAHYYEFWQGGPGRLNDRICYRQTDNKQWNIRRLAP